MEYSGVVGYQGHGGGSGGRVEQDHGVERQRVDRRDRVGGGRGIRGPRKAELHNFEANI